MATPNESLVSTKTILVFSCFSATSLVSPMAFSRPTLVGFEHSRQPDFSVSRWPIARECARGFSYCSLRCCACRVADSTNTVTADTIGCRSKLDRNWGIKNGYISIRTFPSIMARKQTQSLKSTSRTARTPVETPTTRLHPDTNAATPLLLSFALQAGARKTHVCCCGDCYSASCGCRSLLSSWE